MQNDPLCKITYLQEMMRMNIESAYLLRISGPFMTMQCAPVSFATAFAISVFPVPGGPCKITPRGAETPKKRAYLSIWYNSLVDNSYVGFAYIE